jgi:hypothetical protein
LFHARTHTRTHTPPPVLTRDQQLGPIAVCVTLVSMHARTHTQLIKIDGWNSNGRHSATVGYMHARAHTPVWLPGSLETNGSACQPTVVPMRTRTRTVIGSDRRHWNRPSPSATVWPYTHTHTRLPVEQEINSAMNDRRRHLRPLFIRTHTHTRTPASVAQGSTAEANDRRHLRPLFNTARTRTHAPVIEQGNSAGPANASQSATRCSIHTHTHTPLPVWLEIDGTDQPAVRHLRPVFPCTHRTHTHVPVVELGLDNTRSGVAIATVVPIHARTHCRCELQDRQHRPMTVMRPLFNAAPQHARTHRPVSSRSTAQ